MSVPFASEISFNFTAPVWEIHTWEQLLLITTKDQDSLETRFSLVDHQRGELIFESIGFEEDWWISAFLFNGEQIVFQLYNDTQDIEDRSVFCFDIKTEEVLWSIDGVKLQQVNASTIGCKSIDADDSQAFLVDVATGHEIDFPKDAVIASTAQFPYLYDSENQYHQMLTDFLTKRGVIGFIGAIEYLEFNDLIFFGLNFEEVNTYSLKLYVYDAEGGLLLEVILEKDLKGRASGSFFILDQALIFVKDKCQLKICSIA